MLDNIYSAFLDKRNVATVPFHWLDGSDITEWICWRSSGTEAYDDCQGTFKVIHICSIQCLQAFFDITWNVLLKADFNVQY